MFLGEYEHTLDEKNRLTLPAKFRQALADGLVISRGLDDCLAVYSRDAWERFVAERLEGLHPFSREARELTRFVFPGASESELDRQGRVIVPPPLAEHAKLSREVVVAGVGDHIEIWDRTAWRNHLEEVRGTVELVAERLAGKQD